MKSTIELSRNHPVNIWPLHLSQRQAAILYPSNPQRQQHAILEHIRIAQACTMNVQRWRWLAAIGARLAAEVQP